MLLIHCPFCGPRDEIEFRCSGESHIARPAQDESVSDEIWSEYLHFRKNPKGMHYERWLHWAGCKQWFNAARNTVTHEIVKTYRVGEAP